jgi:zinc protease
MAHPEVPIEELTTGVLDEIARLADGGPSEAELERVRKLRHAEFASSMERASERADRIGLYASLFGDPDRVNSEMERYASVDSPAVKQVVADFLRPERSVQLFYRPMQTAD